MAASAVFPFSAYGLNRGAGESFPGHGQIGRTGVSHRGYFFLLLTALSSPHVHVYVCDERLASALKSL
jgi:hypothetical protein